MTPHSEAFSFVNRTDEFDFYMCGYYHGSIGVFDGQRVGFIHAVDEVAPNLCRPIVADTIDEAQEERLIAYMTWISTEFNRNPL